MKKLLSLLLCALLCMFCLIGCAKMKDGTAENMMDDGGMPFGDVSGTLDASATLDSSIIENEFVNTADTPVSTFAADVDTASYAYFRKLVNQDYDWDSLIATAGNHMRTEEMINYFQYQYDGPAAGELFGVNAVIADCPWNENSKLMVLGLQSETTNERKPNNLVFLIDVSGSMSSNDKLPLLKEAFATLVGQLTADDRISIVTYSGKERVVLEGCPGNQGDRIIKAVNSLEANGSTNGEAGLQKAYALAEEYRIADGNNRIIMASDGDLNVGISSQEDLQRYISDKRNEGVFLSVLGFGTGNYRDSKMETIANHGNGVYYYIDGESEAEKVLGSDLFSTLYTVAKDTKLQVTFSPEHIAQYRLVGYENRRLAAEDFADDSKDGGEVGAGHCLTICYELIITDKATESTEPWMTLAIRYKEPDGTKSQLNEYSIGAEALTDTPSEDFTFTANVVMVSMLLHKSRYIQNVTLADIIENLGELSLSAPDRTEFYTLLQKLKK